MATTSNRRGAAKVMFVSALLTLGVAVAIYAGMVPIDDARVRNLIALSIASVAAIDVSIGIFHLTRS